MLTSGQIQTVALHDGYGGFVCMACATAADHREMGPTMRYTLDVYEDGMSYEYEEEHVSERIRYLTEHYPPMTRASANRHVRRHLEGEGYDRFEYHEHCIRCDKEI